MKINPRAVVLLIVFSLTLGVAVSGEIVPRWVAYPLSFLVGFTMRRWQEYV